MKGISEIYSIKVSALIAELNRRLLSVKGSLTPSEFHDAVRANVGEYLKEHELNLRTWDVAVPNEKWNPYAMIDANVIKYSVEKTDHKNRTFTKWTVHKCFFVMPDNCTNETTVEEYLKSLCRHQISETIKSMQESIPGYYMSISQTEENIKTQTEKLKLYS